MNKIIRIWVIVATIIFSLIYIITIAFTNPLECYNSKEIILLNVSIYSIIMICYWIYCIFDMLIFESNNRKKGGFLLSGMLLFYTIPIILKQGLLNRIGVCLIIFNIIMWGVYYIRIRDIRLLLLICGFLVILLTLPYCEILWD